MTDRLAQPGHRIQGDRCRRFDHRSIVCNCMAAIGLHAVSGRSAGGQLVGGVDRRTKGAHSLFPPHESRFAARRRIDPFWDMQPLAGGSGDCAAGLIDSTWDEAAWSDGLSLFATTKSLRQLQEQGTGRVEIQVPASDNLWPVLLKALGFEQVETSLVLSKE